MLNLIKMEEVNRLADYYKILESERSATVEELKKNYQRLALSCHPDKSAQNKAHTFVMVQKAWSVLREPESRKQYDALLTCYENSDILLYNTIFLSEMDYDSVNEVYSYVCRCSGIYYLERNEIVFPSVIISCNECSFSIQVDLPENIKTS